MKHYDCGFFGEYKNRVYIKMPDDWKTKRKNRYFFIDACIAPEIIYLIINGVRTIASCCGHDQLQPTVCVDKKSISLMRGMGYRHDMAYISRNDIFILKGMIIDDLNR